MTYVVKFLNPKHILSVLYQTRVWLYLE